MKLQSRDRTMTLSIAAPGTGFALTLDVHVWLFDRDSRIIGSIPPHLTVDEVAAGVARHIAVSSPEACPGCAGFVLANYGQD